MQYLKMPDPIFNFRPKPDPNPKMPSLSLGLGEAMVVGLIKSTQSLE